MKETACAYCGKVGEKLVRDHVIPRSRGGPDTPKNIVMACSACNSSKSDRTPSEWRTGLPFAVLEIERNITKTVELDLSARRRKDFRARQSLVPGMLVLLHLDNDATTWRNPTVVGEVQTADAHGVRITLLDWILGSFSGYDAWFPWCAIKSIPLVYTEQHDYTNESNVSHFFSACSHYQERARPSPSSAPRAAATNGTGKPEPAFSAQHLTDEDLK